MQLQANLEDAETESLFNALCGTRYGKWCNQTHRCESNVNWPEVTPPAHWQMTLNLFKPDTNTF